MVKATEMATVAKESSVTLREPKIKLKGSSAGEGTVAPVFAGNKPVVSPASWSKTSTATAGC